MADREFRIKITTTADTAGARETADDLGKVRDATKDTVPANEEAAKSADKNALSNRELRQAMRLVAQESPEAAIALKAFASNASAVSIGLAAVSLAVRRTQEDLKALNESLNTSDWETYAGVVE